MSVKHQIIVHRLKKGWIYARHYGPRNVYGIYRQNANNTLYRGKTVDTRYQEGTHKLNIQVGRPQAAPFGAPSMSVLAFITKKKKAKFPLTELFPSLKTHLTNAGLFLASVCCAFASLECISTS